MTIADRFKDAFGVDIRPYNCFHGFDILKFDDEFLKSHDGSMADEIRRRFSEAAVTLVHELCKVRHPMDFYREEESNVQARFQDHVGK